MSTVSLTIENKARYEEILQAARDNGSIDSLLDYIVNFTASERVVLRPHLGSLEFAIFWYAGDDKLAYMFGALIYHSSNNSWRTHT